MYVLETGCQWSHLEVKDGSWKTIYHYFSIWNSAHLFIYSHNAILRLYEKKKGIGHNLLIDTSFIKNIFGKNCRKATKVSALVDESGIPLTFTFHPGNKNDSRTLFHTLNKAPVNIQNKRLYADKIYDTAHCTNILKGFNLQNHVSKKSVQRRHLITVFVL